MQHIWKALLTSLLIFALAATACLAEDSEAQYQAYSYTTFSLRRTPSESDRGISVQKKTKILILEWDDVWCKVQVGNKVGYAKPEWLYRVQSLDALHYPLQNLPHRMSGYVEFSQDTLISGGKFKGCTASAGQIACVEAQADGAYLLPVWRGEMQLTDENRHLSSLRGLGNRRTRRHHRRLHHLLRQAAGAGQGSGARTQHQRRGQAH